MSYEKVIIRDCTLYRGDWNEVFPSIDRVDVVLTDPPYGLGKKMQGGTWGKEERYGEQWKWDVAPSIETINKLSSLGHAIIWGGNYFNLQSTRCWLIWDKRNAVPTCADAEMAWTNLDRPTKRFSWPVGVHEYGHHCQKPLALMEWCLSFIPNGTVFDPYMGTGTTLVACVNHGRKAIGVEIEKKYFDIACKRIEKAYADQALLDLMPEPEPIEQPVMFKEAS